MKLTENLTENYRPSDLSAAANVACVLLALKEIESHDAREHTESTTPPQEMRGQHHNPAKTHESTDDIYDELSGAEKYYNRYADTKDPAVVAKVIGDEIATVIKYYVHAEDDAQERACQAITSVIKETVENTDKQNGVKLGYKPTSEPPKIAV